MKNTIHFILVMFAAYLFNQNLLAQNNTERIIEDDEYTKVTPPSPTAYELVKYGQVPVGYFTGTPIIIKCWLGLEFKCGWCYHQDCKR